MSPAIKFIVEMGPVLVFFVTYFVGKRFYGEHQGLIYATGVFVVVTLIALATSYFIERKVPMVTLVTAILVTGLGALTIYLDDETFIKRKPTYVSGFLGAVLLGGLAMGKPLVKLLMQGAIQMRDEGWRKLTLRWGIFLLALAGMNEVVWRNYSTDTWLSYKTFGILPLTILFLVLQGPLITKYAIEPEEDASRP
ncbi:Intracellular septation protein [Planctomycetes bacterium Poly30]|uniref:Intracellular septation protein n=1 Tax=Saltatorellus ferox TaxID=2528018 RepID=A0A518ERB4_9BACT|nr:Intracellular septation protein [Planctomycetes bacterium Poly30]